MLIHHEIRNVVLEDERRRGRVVAVARNWRKFSRRPTALTKVSEIARQERREAAISHGKVARRDRRRRHMRGVAGQGVHLLETCSLYPLLIERSALGSTGVDWTHQQPLTVAPSRRPLPPTLPYVRKDVYVCVVRVGVYMPCLCVCVAESERVRQPKDAPKRFAQGMVIPGVARTISTCALRTSFMV